MIFSASKYVAAFLVPAAALLFCVNRQDDAPSRPPLFNDWPKPQAVFIFSGQQHGYLEPCGCSPEVQKGGLARRLGFIKMLQQKGWPVVMADLGGLLEDPTQQPAEGKAHVGPEHAKVKLETALEALHRMQYAALNLAPEDVATVDGFLGLMGLLGNMNDPPLPRSINANFKWQKFYEEDGYIFPHVTREVGGQRIAIIGMVGKDFKERFSDQDLKDWQAPDVVLRATLAELKPRPDLRVLMLYGKLDEAKELAKKFPDLDLIIYADNTEEPSDKPVWADDKEKTMLVTIGAKGKNVGTVGIFEESPRLRFELVPLDNQFNEDPGIRELLDTTYIDKLRSLDLVAKYPRVPYDKAKPDRGFVGSKKCGECHVETYKFYLTTRHAHALETLVKGFVDPKTGKKIAAGKEVNPECASCHTTGFFHNSGYDGTAATAHLGGNGCENCHRPGSVHVKIMSNLDAEREDIALAKEMMHLPPQDIDDHNVCIRCHDGENSPRFRIGPYWEQVDHGGPAAEDKDNWPKIREKLLKEK